MDLVKDRLLEGVAWDDHETTGVFFFFSDSVTTAVWVGVWKGGQGMTMSMRVRKARVVLQGGRAQEMDAYKTSLVNNRGLDEEERPRNSEDREESKGWKRLQAPEAAPFVCSIRPGDTGGRVRSRVLGQADVLSLVLRVCRRRGYEPGTSKNLMMEASKRVGGGEPGVRLDFRGQDRTKNS